MSLYDTLTTTIITVQNAGKNPANGEYRHVEVEHQSGYFLRTGVFPNISERYTISFDCLGSEYLWCISIGADETSPPDRNKDVVLYLCRSYTPLPPPVSGWQICENNGLPMRQLQPLPKITVQQRD